MVLSYEIKGCLTMFPLTRILTLAAVGALVALTATSIPVRADELDQLRSSSVLRPTRPSGLAWRTTMIASPPRWISSKSPSKRR
jgi:hypothetical protein